MIDQYADLEAKLEAVKTCRQLEHAVEMCKMGVVNKGIIYKIAAETDYGVHQGGAERSINCVFTAEESAKIFQAVEEMLTVRLTETKAKLGF